MVVVSADVTAAVVVLVLPDVAVGGVNVALDDGEDDEEVLLGLVEEFKVLELLAVELSGVVVVIVDVLVVLEDDEEVPLVLVVELTVPGLMVTELVSVAVVAGVDVLAAVLVADEPVFVADGVVLPGLLVVLEAMIVMLW